MPSLRQSEAEQTSVVTGYYDRYWGAEVTPEYVLGAELDALLRENVQAGIACIDVGCGAGRTYAQWVAPQAGRYVGVDVSPKAVELARGAGVDARVIQDASDLPFDDESFDLAICIEVFEHLFAPHEAAHEIWRVLRPGGRLIASVPNYAYWRMRANSVIGAWNPMGDYLAVDQPWRDPHIRFFTRKVLTRMLTRAGFRDVSIGGHGGTFLDHATARPTDFGTSRAYRYLERLLPSVFGLTLHVAATRE